MVYSRGESNECEFVAAMTVSDEGECPYAMAFQTFSVKWPKAENLDFPSGQTLVRASILLKPYAGSFMPSITGSIDQFSWIVIPLRILRQVLWGTLYRRFVNITDWIPRLILPQIMQRQMLVHSLVIVFDAWRMHLTLLVPISHRILDRIQALMG